MIKRYDANTLKIETTKYIKISIISFIMFIITFIVAAIIEKLWVGIISVIFFLITCIILILCSSKYSKLEQERHYQFIEDCIEDFKENGNKSLEIIYQLYLNDIVKILKNLGIRSYVYLNIYEEQLELDLIKDDKKLVLKFKEYEVEYSILNDKWEKDKIEFNNVKEVLDFINKKYTEF